jgi:hypothetical protein
LALLSGLVKFLTLGEGDLSAKLFNMMFPWMGAASLLLAVISMGLFQHVCCSDKFGLLVGVLFSATIG